MATKACVFRVAEFDNDTGLKEFLHSSQPAAYSTFSVAMAAARTLLAKHLSKHDAAEGVKVRAQKQLEVATFVEAWKNSQLMSFADLDDSGYSIVVYRMTVHD